MADGSFFPEIKYFQAQGGGGSHLEAKLRNQRPQGSEGLQEILWLSECLTVGRPPTPGPTLLCGRQEKAAVRTQDLESDTWVCIQALSQSGELPNLSAPVPTSVKGDRIAPNSQVDVRIKCEHRQILFRTILGPDMHAVNVSCKLSGK